MAKTNVEKSKQYPTQNKEVTEMEEIDDLFEMRESSTVTSATENIMKRRSANSTKPVMETAEGDDFDWEESTSEDADLMTIPVPPVKVLVAPGVYLAEIGTIRVEEKPAREYGAWTAVVIPFVLNIPGSASHPVVSFVASRTLNENSRLRVFIEGIVGPLGKRDFNLASLQGKRVYVTVFHKTDSNGNVWENISSARK